MAEEKRQAVLQRKNAREKKAAAKETAAAEARRELSPASQARRTRQRWQASGIVSLRGLALAELPDLAHELRELGPEATSSLYAVDVGNNMLHTLPGGKPA